MKFANPRAPLTSSEPGSEPELCPWQSEPGSRLFVWLWWTALLAVALGDVANFGPRVPIWDDYDVIPVLTGQQPLTLEWLWSLHSEHRIFLPRLILLGAFRLTGDDFRAGMVVNVVLLAALSAMAVVVLRLARREWRYSDAFYPLVFLNLGHHVNLIWNMSLSYILPVFLGGAVTLLIAIRPGLPGVGRGSLIGLALLMLPLCNAAGVALAPLPTLWLLGVALAHARSGSDRARSSALATGLAACGALALSVLYFHHYERATHHPLPPSLWAIVRTILQFLGTGLGPAGIQLGLVGGGIVTTLLVSAFLVLLRRLVTRRAERSRALGLLACWGAMAMLALGTGWGRAGLGELAGAQDRYVTLAALALLIGAVPFEVLGSRATRRLVPMFLFCLLCALLWPNTQSAIESGRSTKAKSEAFFADLRSGMPPFLLVRRYTPFLFPTHDDLTEQLAMLREAGIDPFDRMAPNPPFREVEVVPAPTWLQLAEWEGRTIKSIGVDPQVVFEIQTSGQPIAGIKFDYSHTNFEGEPAHFKMAWRRPGQIDFPPDQEYSAWALPTGTARSTTIWIGEPVDAIRLQPDNRPSQFTIEKMTLLLP